MILSKVHIVFQIHMQWFRTFYKSGLLPITSLMFLLLPGHSQEIIKTPKNCDSCAQQLRIDFSASAFIKNNEWTNEFTRGFTGIGHLLEPRLVYYASSKTKISLGSFLLQYGGSETIDKLIPVFSIRHQFDPETALVIGRLQGHLFHRLEEPLYRYDRFYTDNFEYGIQWLWKNDFVDSDLWLDWDAFLREGEDKQEQFQLGLRQDWRPFKIFPGFKFRIQMLLTHWGGEIDVSPLPAASILNTLAGPALTLALNEHLNLHFEALNFYYNGLSLPKEGMRSMPFEKGNAWYLKARLSHRNFEFMYAYWSANKFIAPFGEYQFLSVSDYNPGFKQENRKLFRYVLQYKQALSKSLNMCLRGDLYHDIQSGKLENSVFLVLSFNESFLLKRLKN